jgi:hypothetical protein
MKNSKRRWTFKAESPCSFCLREEWGDDPALGRPATGSYRKDRGFGLEKPVVFSGYVCDMHADNVEWVSLKFKS